MREGVADLMWCGERLEALRRPVAERLEGVRGAGARLAGRVADGRQLAREQLAVARRVGAPGALGLSLRSRGAGDRGDEGLALLEEAVSVLEGSSARLELAHALADLGASWAAPDAREGRDAQRRAIELADECGAIALAERARAELHAGPGRRARIELTGPGALTAAEWRVCRQVAEGRTNREVAQALFVTEKTVERHLSSAYQKLGIRSASSCRRRSVRDRVAPPSRNRRENTRGPPSCAPRVQATFPVVARLALPLLPQAPR